MKAYRAVLQLSTFRTVFRELLGARGQDAYGTVRVVEITYSPRAGFHPHIHCALLTPAPVPATRLEAAREWIAEKWADKAERAGLRRPSSKHGCDLRPASANAVASYVAKNTVEVRGLSSEVARGDVKRNSVWDLLRAAVSGSRTALARWHEYEHATKGRRLMWWSAGLRERLVPVEEGDELAAQREGTTDEEPEVVGYLSDDAWRAVSRRRLVARLLYAVWKGGYAGASRLLAEHGLSPPMVGDPWAVPVAAEAPIA